MNSIKNHLQINYLLTMKQMSNTSWVENAASHNGIFVALERRQSHVDNTPVFLS